MSAAVFDTHDYFNQLKGAGFSEQQAETITQLHKATVSVALEQARHDYELDQIATKRDLKELETGLRQDIELIRKDIEIIKAENKRDLAETKADLIRWVVAVGLLQITVIAGLILRLTGRI